MSQEHVHQDGLGRGQDSDLVADAGPEELCDPGPGDPHHGVVQGVTSGASGDCAQAEAGPAGCHRQHPRPLLLRGHDEASPGRRRGHNVLLPRVHDDHVGLHAQGEVRPLQAPGQPCPHRRGHCGLKTPGNLR